MTEITPKAELPIMTPSAATGSEGVALVDLCVTRMGHLFSERPKHDYGIDGVIGLVDTADGKRRVTGREIAAQIKHGQNAVYPTVDHFVLYASLATGNYWLSHSLPVIAIYVDRDTEICHWSVVTAETLRRTGKGWALDIPRSSDLAQDRDALVMTAGAPGKKRTPEDKQGLMLVFDESFGLRGNDDELGAALAGFAQAIRHNRRAVLSVEIATFADVMAALAAAEAEPLTAETSKTVYTLNEILARYEQKAHNLSLGLTLMFSHGLLSESFGHDFVAYAAGARTFAEYYVLPRITRSRALGLVAWPSDAQQEPEPKIDLDEAERAALQAKLGEMPLQLALGPYGGALVGDLGQGVIARKAVPAITFYVMALAARTERAPEAVLEKIGLHPAFWRLGIA
jgi:hypothetical protein